MYLYFIASDNGGGKVSSGTIERGKKVVTSQDFTDITNEYRDHVANDTGIDKSRISIRAFNRIN